ncbi:hypothetical protein NADFUDRAFT_67339 [Nadsonia fulvescens var. elongata DSM 6958]|uniref:PASTA domain-containing protein n=1 Tax=Nadsonia fulvescens var. elongata DSM 6958 TaxID=857566 RepID=A0A1E3PFJ7_9ASCO|nr:hypothetical protein NADFUDRAFT_67339 [Nadsonia fulvescens var. elongata DSM 6958]
MAYLLKSRATFAISLASRASSSFYRAFTTASPLLNQVNGKNAGEESKTVIPMLSRPIGLEDAPKSTDPHYHINNKTFKERRSDFFNLEKNKQERLEINREIFDGTTAAKNISDYNSTKGKSFFAPDKYFRRDKSLYMPNFLGQTLIDAAASTTVNNEGLEATTDRIINTNPQEGQAELPKVSIIRIHLSSLSQDQCQSYLIDRPQFQQRWNLVEGKDFQIIDINIPHRWVDEMIVKLSKSSIRSKLAKHRHQNYFIIGKRNKMRKEIVKLFNMEKIHSGHVLLVDNEARIRWASCGPALADERECMWKFVRSISKE